MTDWDDELAKLTGEVAAWQEIISMYRKLIEAGATAGEAREITAAIILASNATNGSDFG